jgi:Ca2+-binding RTX toxin-like protein
MAIITGTSGDDKEPNELDGTDLADQIFGLAGNDTLVGFGGDDVLEGGAGADELFGSGGFDTASYRNSPTGVVAILGEGSYADRGDATGDELFSVEGLIGSAFGDGLGGDDLRNVLRGGGGGDEMAGAGGDDTLYGEGGGDLVGGGDGKDRIYGGDGNDGLAGQAGDDVLNGGAGSDTAYFSDSPVTVRLNDGTARGGVLDGSDLLSSIENATGSFFGDTLVGNGGANRLTGRDGSDVLVGNGGADRFVYEYTYDSGAPGQPEAPDRIVDFSRSQGDKINLRAIDANEQVDGDQAFQFIGQAQFTGVGQLRFVQEDGDTFVQANTSDATAGPEMTIELEPLVALQATDFLL